MKIISKNFKILALLLLFLGLTSCNNDDDNDGPIAQSNTIIDVALDNNLTALAAALEVTGLVDDLQGTGPFTVFAPDNDAFATLLADTGLDLDNLSTDEENLVRNILLNHVIVGETLTSTNLVNASAGYRNTLATGPNNNNLSIYFNTSNGVMLNGISTVTDADNLATNGVLHIVNTVITLPTIATFATSNPALSNLVAALQLADTGMMPTVNWINTVSGEENDNLEPFTVFAPTNAAFSDLLVELDPSGSTALGDLDPATVDAVLTNHVVASANVQSSGLGSLNGTIPTLGGDLTLNGTVITDANGRDSNILAPDLVDIQAINGVVHAIDTVILPQQ